MKKQIMKRAWEIYRTLVGDRIAKLSMAMRMAWAEVKQTASKMVGTAKQIAWAEDIKAMFIERVNQFVKESRRAEAIELINAKTDAAWWIENRDIFALCKTGTAMKFIQTGIAPAFGGYTGYSAHN